MQIDPQLLFPRLLIVAINEFTDLKDLFKYDLCSNPVLLTPYRMRSNLNKCHNLANHSMFLVEEHSFMVSYGNTIQPFLTSAAAMFIMLLNDMAGVLLYLTVTGIGPRRESTNAVAVHCDLLSTLTENKCLINMVGQTLKEAGCDSIHAEGDTDVLMVQSAVSVAATRDTAVIADDTDILILFCYHGKNCKKKLCFKSEPK